jgi:hypothetical protein
VLLLESRHERIREMDGIRLILAAPERPAKATQWIALHLALQSYNRLFRQPQRPIQRHQRRVHLFARLRCARNHVELLRDLRELGTSSRSAFARLP